MKSYKRKTESIHTLQVHMDQFTQIDHIREHKIKLYILKALVHDMFSDHNRNKSVGNDK